MELHVRFYREDEDGELSAIGWPKVILKKEDKTPLMFGFVRMQIPELIAYQDARYSQYAEISMARQAATIAARQAEKQAAADAELASVEVLSEPGKTVELAEKPAGEWTREDIISALKHLLGATGK